MKKSVLFYPLIIGIFTVLIWFVIEKGSLLKTNEDKTNSSELVVTSLSSAKSNAIVIDSNESVWQQFLHNIKSPLGLLLLQIIVILVISRVFGLLFSRFGQPGVVGEMVA